MKMKFSNFLVIAVIAGIALSLVGMALVSQAAPEPPVARKIVVFSGELNEPAQNALLKNFGGIIIKDLPLINGKAVLLSPKAEKALAKSAGVLRIDNDDEVFILDKPAITGKPPKEPVPQPPETLSWGVDRIDADLAWGTSTGQGVKVAILDTGIDIDHPDLLVAGGANVLGPFRTEKYNDNNGHGTHVAGIVAALDNDIGVIGVSPGAKLYAVKAFNRKGIGFVSDIVDGIDWSINNLYGRMDVINMSFGEVGDNSSLRQAILEAYNAGIVMVAAAGNDGDAFIYYPARYPQTIAVSATCSQTQPGEKYGCSSETPCIMTDGDDGLASFSSYATSSEQAAYINLLAAPGQNIQSTWKDGKYYAGNGTSMATPHVVGTAALVIASGVSDANEDRRINDEVMNILKDTAEDLNPITDPPTTGLDIYFGYGLVDAENAVK